MTLGWTVSSRPPCVTKVGPAWGDECGKEDKAKGAFLSPGLVAIIPEFRRLRQDCHGFKTSVGYNVRLSIKTTIASFSPYSGPTVLLSVSKVAVISFLSPCVNIAHCSYRASNTSLIPWLDL